MSRWLAGRGSYFLAKTQSMYSTALAARAKTRKEKLTDRQTEMVMMSMLLRTKSKIVFSSLRLRAAFFFFFFFFFFFGVGCVFNIYEHVPCISTSKLIICACCKATDVNSLSFPPSSSLSLSISHSFGLYVPLSLSISLSLSLLGLYLLHWVRSWLVCV